MVESKDKFIERWATAERINVRLSWMLSVVCGAVIVLSAAIVFLIMQPKPVYYIPSAWASGVAMPHSSTSKVAGLFAYAWVLNWNNFTPANVADVYANAKRFMSAAFLVRSQQRLNRDVEEVKKNNISSMFSITKEPVVLAHGDGFKITVEGEKGSYMANEQIKLQHLSFIVRVKKVVATETNPYGLLIDDIDMEDE